jgi:bifunctional DNase/RNase
MADLVRVQLARIVKNDLTDKQLIYLKEVDGDRQFPIIIGFFEATNIDLRVTDAERPPRPLTHDLIVGVAQSLGAKVDSVVITNFQDDIFYAVLRLLRNGETIDVDARPSDAIAVSASFRPILPIWVAQEVFDRFSQ